MKRLRRITIAFIIITGLVFAAGMVYQLFGRGVVSPYMRLAFIYPLLFGVLFNLLLMIVQKQLPFVGTVGFRLYSNIYNTGIAALTLYSFLMGVMDIAQAASPWTPFLAYIGWTCIAVGLCTFCILLVRSVLFQKRYKKRRNKR